MPIYFPYRLHDMLDEAQKKGHDHIVSWSRDGKSFKIHQPHLMVPILQQYFRQTKYQSFRRQLYGYGFLRQRYGEGKGQVFHPLFVHGQRSMSKGIKRNRIIKISQHNTMPSTYTIPILPHIDASTSSKISTDGTANTTASRIDSATALPWTLDEPYSNVVVHNNYNLVPVDNLTAMARVLLSSRIDPVPFSPIIRTSTNPNFAGQAINMQQRQMQALQVLAGVMPTISPPIPMTPPILPVLPAISAQYLPVIMSPMLSAQTLGERTRYIDVIMAAYVFEAKLEIDRILKEYGSADHNNVGNGANELTVKSRIELAYMMYLESRANRL